MKDSFSLAEGEVSERQVEVPRGKQRPDGIVFERHIKSDHGAYDYTKEIHFRDSGEGEIHLETLLPPEWKFSAYDEQDKKKVISGEPKFSTDQKTKTISYGDITKKGGVFALLHEIGHAWLYETGDSSIGNEEILKSYTGSYANRLLVRDTIVEQGGNFDDYIDIVVYDAYGKGTGGFDNDDSFFHMFVPKNLIAKYGKAWAANERKAWAYALKHLKNFRQAGVILEEELGNLEQIQSQIYSALKTYETHFGKKYQDKTPYFTKGKKFREIDISDLIS